MEHCSAMEHKSELRNVPQWNSNRKIEQHNKCPSLLAKVFYYAGNIIWLKWRSYFFCFSMNLLLRMKLAWIMRKQLLIGFNVASNKQKEN